MNRGGLTGVACAGLAAPAATAGTIFPRMAMRRSPRGSAGGGDAAEPLNGCPLQAAVKRSQERLWVAAVVTVKGAQLPEHRLPGPLSALAHLVGADSRRAQSIVIAAKAAVG